jgi:hypothetical protein
MYLNLSSLTSTEAMHVHVFFGDRVWAGYQWMLSAGLQWSGSVVRMSLERLQKDQDPLAPVAFGQCPLRLILATYKRAPLHGKSVLRRVGRLKWNGVCNRSSA